MARRTRLIFLAAPGALFLGLFFLLPLCVVGGEAFWERGTAFGRVFGDPLFWQGLAGSLVLAGATAGVSLLVGFLVALHLSRLPELPRFWLVSLVSLPLTFSGLIVAYGFILSFGRAGFVTLSLAELGMVDPAAFAGFIYSPIGLGFAYAYFLIPRVILLLLPVLVNFDRIQLLAAESLGAPRPRALMEVSCPDPPQPAHRLLPGGGGGPGGLRHRPGPGGDPGQHPAALALQQDFRDRRRLPRRCRPLAHPVGPLLADHDRRRVVRLPPGGAGLAVTARSLRASCPPSHSAGRE